MSLENKFKVKFGDAIEILNILNENSFEAYFVGGCVRDYLMGVNFNDIDITTSATPVQVKKIFKKTIDTGIKHGTVTVVFKGGFYEVTTFRSEKDYVNHRQPENVEFITNLEEDLKRRDFTVNAMTLNRSGEVIDLHNGLQDIEKRIIRTVNNPEERFEEDALRMLRAFRFASKLTFEIEENTFNAIEKKAPLITYISIERILSEFKKLLVGNNNEYALNKLISSGLSSYIPFIQHIRNYVNFHKYNFSQSLFILCDLNGIDITECKKLKISNNEYLKVKNYLTIKEQFLKNSNIKEILYYNDKKDVEFVNNYYNFLNVEELKMLILPIQSFNDVNVTNKEIINLYPERKAGYWIKEIVLSVEKAILEGKLENDKHAIINYIRKDNGFKE